MTAIRQLLPGMDSPTLTMTTMKPAERQRPNGTLQGAATADATEEGECTPGVHIMPVALLDRAAQAAAQQRTSRYAPANRVFQPRAMFKSELAAWYGISLRSFSDNYLTVPEVARALKRKGYDHKRTRLLSLAMVNIIVAFFDNPSPE